MRLVRTKPRGRLKPEFTWRIAREAWPLLAALVVLAGVAWATGPGWVAGLVVAAAVAVAAFFRDPRRRVAADPGVAVAPGDGRVVRVAPGGAGGGPEISLFLSIFNVHVNRAPVSGEVVRVERTAGGFRAAFRPEAATGNERVEVAIATPHGIVTVAQVAGLLARRIVCRAQPGDRLEAGERYGLIQFGSRLDVRLPEGSATLVERGEKTRGGVTPIARLGRRRRET